MWKGNRILLALCALIMAMMICGGGSTILAQTITWAERPLLNWERDALKTFERNNYDKVIDMVQSQEDDPNGNVPLLTYYGHAQKYYLERNRGFCRLLQTTLPDHPQSPLRGESNGTYSTGFLAADLLEQKDKQEVSGCSL